MKKLFVLLFFISCQTTKAPLIDSSTGVTKTLIPLKDSFLKLYIEVYKSPEETYGNLKPIYQDIVERGFDYLDKNVYQ